MGTAIAKQDRIGARVPHEVYETLCRAAELTGATVNQFLVQAALKEAQEVIEREEVIRLSPRDWNWMPWKRLGSTPLDHCRAEIGCRPKRPCEVSTMKPGRFWFFPSSNSCCGGAPGFVSPTSRRAPREIGPRLDRTVRRASAR